MNQLLSLDTPLQSTFLAKNSTVAKKTLLVLTGIFLLALSAQLSIPLKPVPLTFQSTTLILIAMIFGARTSAYIVLGSALAGIAGLPVFADFTFGITKFIGPTGGYLIGFLPAAIVSGYLAQKGFAKSIIGSFIAACLGTSIIFFCGVSTLAILIGWQSAISLGAAPFLISEIIKLLAVSILVPTMWK